jgi:hypothetical protein
VLEQGIYNLLVLVYMLACITKVLEQGIYIVVICNRMLPKYNVAATLQVFSVVHMLLAFILF